MYREFLANFACNIRRVSPTRRPIVYALDRRTHTFASKLGLSSVLLSDDEGDDVQPGAFQKEGHRSFNSITKMKLTAVRRALKAGLDVLLSDADIFWCADAAQVLETMLSQEPYLDADVVIQPEANYRTLNSGFYYVRSGERALRVFAEMIRHIGIGAHDQDVVNKVFCDPSYGGRRIDEPYGEVPFRCESHGAIIRVLPSAQFPSGAEEYGGTKVFAHSRARLESMCVSGRLTIVHNNFIRATKKKARFIQKGMWFASFDRHQQPTCRAEPVPESDAAQRTCGTYC